MDYQPRWMRNRAPAPWGSSIATTNSDFGPPVLESRKRRFQQLSTVGFNEYARTPYKHKTRLLVEIKPKAEQLFETRTISRDRKPLMWRPADAPLRTSGNQVDDENYLTPQNIDARNATRDRVIEGMRFNQAIAVLSDNRRTQHDVDSANRTVRDVFKRDVAGMATLKREFHARQPMRAIMLPPGGALATAPGVAAPIGGGAPPAPLGPPASGASILERRVQKAQDDATRAAWDKARAEALANANNARVTAQIAARRLEERAQALTDAEVATRAADAALVDARVAAVLDDIDKAEEEKREKDAEEAAAAAANALAEAERDAADRGVVAADVALVANMALETPEKQKADADAIAKAAQDAADAAKLQAIEDTKNWRLAQAIAAAVPGGAPPPPPPTNPTGVPPATLPTQAGKSLPGGPPAGGPPTTTDIKPSVTGIIQSGEVTLGRSTIAMMKGKATNMSFDLNTGKGDQLISLMTPVEREAMLKEIAEAKYDIDPLQPGPDLVDLLVIGSYDLLMNGLDAATNAPNYGMLYSNMRNEYLTSRKIVDPAAVQKLDEIVQPIAYLWSYDGASPEKSVRTWIGTIIGSKLIKGHKWGQVGSGLVGGATDQVALAEELKDKPQFESNEQGLIAETITPGAKPDTRITGIHMGTEMKTVGAMRAGEFVPFAALKRRRPPVVLRTPGGDHWSTTMTRDATSQFQNFAQSEAPRKITRLIFPKSHLGILKGNTSTAL